MSYSPSSTQTAVITGGAGFLGSHLADRLLAEGFRVIAIDNTITGSPDNLTHLANNPYFDFICQDVSKFIRLAGPAEFVFHLASPASPIDYLELPIPTLKVGKCT
jgi:dTDP-glucose 4,6-dehydratase